MANGTIGGAEAQDFLTRLGGFGDALGTFFSGSGGNLLGTGLSLNELSRLSELGERSAAGQMLIGEEAAQRAAFQPFTVSTGFGGIGTTPEGGYTTTLSPAMLAQQQQLQALTGGLLGTTGVGGLPDLSGIQSQAFGGVEGALASAMAPRAQREADIYESIRATQRPEEERERLALEQQLAAQGRTGLRTAEFGGSPEQFALAKAQEEAKARASLSAMQQAQQEQEQQLATAGTLFNLGSSAATAPASILSPQLQNLQNALALQYAPEQQLLATLTPGTDLASLAAGAREKGAGLFSQAGISGLEDLLQSEAIRAQSTSNIIQQLIQAQAARNAGEGGGGGGGGGLFSDILGLGRSFLDIFGDQ